MFYIDANIFLEAILYDDEKAHAAKRLLVEIAEGRLDASTSILSWDEIVWKVRKLVSKEKAAEEGRKFTEFPNLELLPADSIVLSEAQNIIETYGLGPRDAIHAASAISRGIREMISEDPDFDNIKELKRKPIGKF